MTLWLKLNLLQIKASYYISCYWRRFIQKLQEWAKKPYSSSILAQSLLEGKLPEMERSSKDKYNSWDAVINGLINKGLIYNYLDGDFNQKYALTEKGVKAFRSNFRGLQLAIDEQAAMTYFYRLSYPNKEER